MSDAIEHRFPAQLAHLRAVRRMVRESLESLQLNESSIDQAVLVLDEIVSNAIEHGESYRKSDSGDRLVIQLRVEQRNLQMDFLDPDVPAELVQELQQMLGNSSDAPILTAERGRGLFLIMASLDELEVVPCDTGGLHLRGKIHKVIG